MSMAKGKGQGIRGVSLRGRAERDKVVTIWAT